MKSTTQLSLKKDNPVKFYQVLIPIVLGLVVIIWLFIHEFDITVFSTFNFTTASVLFLFSAFLLILLRDLCMMWRFRMMTNNDLSWKQAFHINTLSEFTSAVTPRAIGGSSLVIIFLAKEGINTGRSTTIMFVNLFLDELFFIIVCPIIFVFIPINEIFNSSSVIVSSFGVVFAASYLLRFIWTCILYIGIFRRPEWIKKVLLVLFKLPILRRWFYQVEYFSDALVQTSKDMGKYSFLFWIKVLVVTLLSWIAQFLVVNAIFLAFVPINNHLVVFARQLVLWVVMAVSPTPGGSGISELAFKDYYSDIFSSKSAIIFVTVIWRIISYYFYLLLGVILIPKWIKKPFYTNNNVLMK